MCGKLFCSQGQPDPNYGRMVTIGACKASFFDDPTKDFGQVEEGTRCGEGKVGAGEPRPRHAPELTRVCVCVYRCAARTSVWSCRRPTGTPTAPKSVPAMR